MWEEVQKSVMLKQIFFELDEDTRNLLGLIHDLRLDLMLSSDSYQEHLKKAQETARRILDNLNKIEVIVK